MEEQKEEECYLVGGSLRVTKDNFEVSVLVDGHQISDLDLDGGLHLVRSERHTSAGGGEVLPGDGATVLDGLVRARDLALRTVVAVDDDAGGAAAEREEWEGVGM